MSCDVASKRGIPMGAQLRLTVESLAHGGMAVAHVDGRAVFVRGGCPGDVADVEVTDDRGSYLVSDIRALLEPSPDRAEPPCPYFAECGGCQWQHVAYDRQLAEKRGIVRDALRRIGGLDPALVADTVSSSLEYGYRNKIELAVDSSVRPISVGFLAERSDRVVPVDECLLLDGRARSAPRALSGAIRYLAGHGELPIDRIALRVARHTSALEIALWGPTSAFPRRAAATTLASALPATSVVRVMTRGEASSRRVAKVEVLKGKGFWRERLSGFTYRVSAPSFFQVNTVAAESLVEHALRLLDPDGSSTVLDLYSGAGTFTLPLAKRARHVLAIESSAHALRDLEDNLERADLEADIIPGDASRALSEAGRFDAAIIDPPRAGLAKAVLRALTDAAPSRIVYVSCDPATLARDAKGLVAAGYRLTAAVPLDLFPQTFHVETVARFDRT